MSNCCDTGIGFPDAPLMEQLSTNHPIIWREICALQQAILEAASLCSLPNSMCTTVAGTTPMTYVSGVESISVINGGTGFKVDSPKIKFIPPNGANVTPASAEIITNGSSVIAINVTDPGSGYQPISAQLSVSSVDGFGAELIPYTDDKGTIVNIDIKSAGLGYRIGDAIIATRAVPSQSYYTNALIQVSNVSPVGAILSFRIIDGGSGYQDSVTTVQIVSSLLSTTPYSQGAGFAATPIISQSGTIAAVRIDNPGVGYVDILPLVTIIDTGIGAEAVAQVTNGSISKVDVVKPGTNYTDNAIAYVSNPYTAPAPNRPAVLEVGVKPNPYGTDPEHYYRVWQNAVSDKTIQLQISSVISYFTKLKYTITPGTNPITGTTLQWKICW